MSEISMQGTGGVECVTMALDSAAKTAIGTDFDGARGKAVVLSGNNTVGFGSDGGVLFGILRKVEHDGFASVQVKGFACGVPAASGAAVGKHCTVDGSGGIKGAASGGGIITSVENNKADILL